MAIQTKATLASYFETGDKPTQAQFQDVFDSMVVIPPNATFPSVVVVEATASSTSRPIGTVGAQILSTQATASVVGMLGIPAVSTPGAALVSAASTAAQRSLLGIDLVEIGGQIEAPASGAYVLQQYSTFPWTIEWLGRALVSGQCQITAQIDAVNVTGIVSASGNAAEAFSSATGANTVAVGQTVRLVISDASSAGKLSFTLKGTRA